MNEFPIDPEGNSVTTCVTAVGSSERSESWIQTFVNPDPSPASLQSRYSSIGHPPSSEEAVQEIVIDDVVDEVQTGFDG